MNFRLVEPLMQNSILNPVVNWVQIWNVGSHRCSEMKAGVSHSRRLISLIILQARCPGGRSCWKIKNSLQISRMTCSSCCQQHVMTLVPSRIDEYHASFLELGHANEHHLNNELAQQVERVHSRSFA